MNLTASIADVLEKVWYENDSENVEPQCRKCHGLILPLRCLACLYPFWTDIMLLRQMSPDLELGALKAALPA